MGYKLKAEKDQRLFIPDLCYIAETLIFFRYSPWL